MADADPSRGDSKRSAALIAALVSALTGTGASVAFGRSSLFESQDFERRLDSIEQRVQTAEIERAAFTAGVTAKLTTLIERVTALDQKLDRMVDARRPAH